jgi:hypothetical protein
MFPHGACVDCVLNEAEGGGSKHGEAAEEQHHTHGLGRNLKALPVDWRNRVLDIFHKFVLLEHHAAEENQGEGHIGKDSKKAVR